MEVAGGENSGEGGRQVNKAIFLEKKWPLILVYKNIVSLLSVSERNTELK